MTKTGAQLYLVGTVLLLPGTTLLLPAYASSGAATDAAIALLVAATSVLSAAAAIDMVAAVRQRAPSPAMRGAADDPLLDQEDPQPMVARARRGCCCGGGGGGGCLDHPLLVPACMLLGGLLFLAGALLYWPAWAADPLPSAGAAAMGTVANLGTWVFRCGTLSYMTGSGVSLRAALPGLLLSARGGGGGGEAPGAPRAHWARLPAVAVSGIVCFLLGAALYLVGGALSQAALGGFAQTWLAGSFFFVAGAVLFLIPHYCHLLPPAGGGSADGSTEA